MTAGVRRAITRRGGSPPFAEYSRRVIVGVKKSANGTDTTETAENERDVREKRQPSAEYLRESFSFSDATGDRGRTPFFRTYSIVFRRQNHIERQKSDTTNKIHKGPPTPSTKGIEIILLFSYDKRTNLRVIYLQRVTYRFEHVAFLLL